MAIYSFTLVSGNSIRIPYVSHTSFKRGRVYTYDSANPQHVAVIDALKSDSSFEFKKQNTAEEEAAEIAQMEQDQKELAVLRRKQEAELALKAAEFAEQAALKAAADAQEAKEKAEEARKFLASQSEPAKEDAPKGKKEK